MGIVQLGAGLLLMMVAVRYLASAEIGLLSILEIIFGTLSVWVLIGERPSQAALIGGGIVVAAPRSESDCWPSAREVNRIDSRIRTSALPIRGL
jgi:threonine/homoserine efflux transporter RhtA